jgi:hypothetical protein
MPPRLEKAKKAPRDLLTNPLWKNVGLPVPKPRK